MYSGVEPVLARQVAEQLTAKDAFAAHARDELGLSAHMVARPIQAAMTSAATFSVGAALPVLIAVLSPSALLPGWFREGHSLHSQFWGLSERIRAERVCQSRCYVSHSGVPSLWVRLLLLVALSVTLFRPSRLAHFGRASEPVAHSSSSHN